MANTIQNLFPFTNNNADDFVIYPCYCEFAGSIENGKYKFGPTYTSMVNFGKLLQGQKGIIAGVSVTANCSEAEFTSAVDKPLLLRIIHGGNRTPVNPAPFPFANFSQADIFQLQWEITSASMLQEEDFYLDVSGEVNNITSLLNNQLILRVVFNYIKVGADRLKG